MVHSQGGNFGFTAALNAPDKVKAVIAIEPSGSPRQFDAAKVKDVPHLLVWGDYLGTVPVWGQIKGGVDRYRDALRAAGARVDELALPEAGIRGNSHMLIMDRNSDEVARRIQTWMAQRNLMKPQPKPAG
jgi:pimeloyl-ACP methyl ester carboxylesterase